MQANNHHPVEEADQDEDMRHVGTLHPLPGPCNRVTPEYAKQSRAGCHTCPPLGRTPLCRHSNCSFSSKIMRAGIVDLHVRKTGDRLRRPGTAQQEAGSSEGYLVIHELLPMK